MKRSIILLLLLIGFFPYIDTNGNLDIGIARTIACGDDDDFCDENWDDNKDDYTNDDYYYDDYEDDYADEGEDEDEDEDETMITEIGSDNEEEEDSEDEEEEDEDEMDEDENEVNGYWDSLENSSDSNDDEQRIGIAYGNFQDGFVLFDVVVTPKDDDDLKTDSDEEENDNQNKHQEKDDEDSENIILEEEEQEQEDCQGELCPVCGGYKLTPATVTLRSSSDACPSCSCEETIVPDCEKIGQAVDNLINNFPLTLYNIQNSGTKGCRLLFDNMALNADGQDRYTCSDAFPDLQTAIGELEDGWQANGNVCAAVFLAEEGQDIFTDRQLVDLIKYSTLSFSTFFLVTEDGDAYALRNDQLKSIDMTIYEKKLGENGEFLNNTTEFQNYNKAKYFDPSNNIIPKAYMYHEMDIGVSLLQCNTDLGGTLLDFQKIDADLIKGIDNYSIQTDLCGED